MATNNVQTNISTSRGGFARLALVALLGGAIATGFSPIFVRLSEVEPVATGFWRVALALPVLWLWDSFEGRGTTKRRPATAADYRRLIAAGLFFCGDIVLFNWSLRFTSVANASLLSNSVPIFVTLGGWLFFRQRVSLTFLLGLLLALGGAILLIGNSLALSLTNFFGDFLGVVTAIFYAGYLLSIKDLRHNFSAATVMAWSSLVTGLALLIITLMTETSLVPVTIAGWAAVMGFAWVSHVSGQGSIAYALAHLPASFSSVTLLIQPVTATLLGWLILSEAIGPWQAVGGIIVMAGIYIARRGSRSG